MIARAFSLAWILSLAGCGLVHYGEPSTGPIARVRFVSEAPGVTILRQYDDPDCETGEREVARFSKSAITNHKSIGMPLPKDLTRGQQTEVLVTGAQPFYGMVSITVDLYGNMKCRAAFSFGALAGRDYEVALSYISGTCGVTLARIEKDAAGAFVREGRTNLAMPPGKCEAVLTKQYLY